MREATWTMSPDDTYSVYHDEYPVDKLTIVLMGRGSVHVKAEQGSTAYRIKSPNGSQITRAQRLDAGKTHTIDAGEPGPIVIEIEGVTGGIVEIETTEPGKPPKRIKE